MKPFNSIPEQLEKITNRGMTVESEHHASAFLLRKNYYNTVNIYGKFFLKQIQSDQYIPGSKLDEIESLYYFDKEIRSVTFKKLMECEANIKSTIAHIFCEKYPDPDSYLRQSNFRTDNVSKGTFNHFKNDVVAKIVSKYYKPTDPKVNNSISHHMINYNHVPLWVLTNYLTMGNISNFYSILELELQVAISKSFRDSLVISYKRNVSLNTVEFQSFIIGITELRNKIAHDNCIINFTLSESLKYNPFVHVPNRINPSEHRTSFYDTYLVMQMFVSKDNFAKLTNTIRKRMNHLEHKLSSIPLNNVLSSLGFPNNWNKSPKVPQLK